MSVAQRWKTKFAVALAGLAWTVRTQNSFLVHVPITAAVVALAAWLGVDAWRWVAVLLAATVVWSAELMNSAIEELVRAVHPQQDERIGRALDGAAAAVLVASAGAVIVGLIALGQPLLAALGWL